MDLNAQYLAFLSYKHELKRALKEVYKRNKRNVVPRSVYDRFEFHEDYLEDTDPLKCDEDLFNQGMEVFGDDEFGHMFDKGDYVKGILCCIPMDESLEKKLVDYENIMAFIQNKNNPNRKRKRKEANEIYDDFYESVFKKAELVSQNWMVKESPAVEKV